MYPEPIEKSWYQTSILLMEVPGWLGLRGKGLLGESPVPDPPLRGLPLIPVLGLWQEVAHTVLLASGHLALLCRRQTSLSASVEPDQGLDVLNPSSLPS